MRYLLTFFILIIESQIFACQCSFFTEPFEDVSKHMDEVFQGEIFKQELDSSYTHVSPETFANRTIWIKVKKVWLGDINPGDTLKIVYHPTSCAFTSNEGEDFIFTLGLRHPLECYCGIANDESIKKVDSYFNPVLASKEEFSTTIYPNPAFSSFTIFSDSDPVSMSIINTLGQVVLRSNKRRIQIVDLPLGLFMVEIVLPNGFIKREKLVKR
ncbi:MAG: T9SS type A sorting domain-containing protein [Cyclobacteriaceae bacterium]